MSALFEVKCRGCGKTRTLRLRDAHRAKRAEQANMCHSCGTRSVVHSEATVAQRVESAIRMGKANAGRTASLETRAKLAIVRAGRKPALGHVRSDACKAEQARKMTGRSASTETRAKLSRLAHERHGTVPNPDKATKLQLGAWAFEVIRRDNGRCVLCGVPKTVKKSLAAHHILSRSKHPGFALIVNNGVTLCRPCHAGEHSLNGNM